MREITSMPVYIFFKYYVLYYSHDEETLHSFIPRLYLRYKKRSRFEPGPPSPLFVATTPSLDDETSTSKSLCHFAQFRFNPFITEAVIANQWTGFYMITASAMKGLMSLQYYLLILSNSDLQLFFWAAQSLPLNFSMLFTSNI